MSLHVVLPDCLYVAMKASSLFYLGIRGFYIVITSGVVMAKQEVWLSISILFLVRIGVGYFFFRLDFRCDYLYYTFVRRSLDLSLLLLATAYFSGVFHQLCSRSGNSLVGLPFVSTLFFGDSLVLLLASRESLPGVMFLVVALF